MADIRFGDISEFQPNVNQRQYRDAGYGVLIFRVHNGYRPDHIMPDRLAATRATGFVAVGLYQYLAKDRDAAQQAHEFIATIPGGLKANEFPICDCEEGSGDQRGRVNAWFGVVDKWAGFMGTLYAGQSFFRSNLGGSGSWRRPTWMAAYSTREPADPHTFWQNTDRGSFPGLGYPIDGNIYHGTAQQFLRAVRPGGAAPAPAPQEDDGEHTGMSWLFPETAPAVYP